VATHRDFTLTATSYEELKQAARAKTREVIAQRSGPSIATERLLSDMHQFLALASDVATFDTLFIEAVAAAIEADDYTVGRTFDLFTEDGLLYGQHVADIASSIQRDDVITATTHFKSHGLRVRRMVTLESDLKVDDFAGTPVSGWEYYVFSAVDVRLHDGDVTKPNLALGSKATVSLENRLYVSPQDGEFYLYSGTGALIPVWLGDTTPIDTVVAGIRLSGILDDYARAMSQVPYNVKYHLARIDQLLFWEVFKTLEPAAAAAVTPIQE